VVSIRHDFQMLHESERFASNKVNILRHSLDKELVVQLQLMARLNFISFIDKSVYQVAFSGIRGCGFLRKGFRELRFIYGLGPDKKV